MHYAELIEIIHKSKRTDWIDEVHGNVDVRLHRRERNIRLEVCPWMARWPIEESWATSLPNRPTAAAVSRCSLYYGARFVRETILVSVDGGRARVPIPAIGSNRISSEDYDAARLFNDGRTLAGYVKRCKLERPKATGPVSALSLGSCRRPLLAQDVGGTAARREASPAWRYASLK